MIEKPIDQTKNAYVKYCKPVFVMIAVLLLLTYIASYAAPKIHIDTEVINVLDRDYNLFINNNDKV